MFKNERTRAKLTEHCLRTFGTCPFSEVPSEDLIRQDPVPSGPVLSDAQVEGLKKAILATGLSVQQLVTKAWASASTFRGSDRRGGVNGARIRLAPQKDWAINKASGTVAVISKLEKVQSEVDVNVSLADLIVLGAMRPSKKLAVSMYLLPLAAVMLARRKRMLTALTR